MPKEKLIRLEMFSIFYVILQRLKTKNKNVLSINNHALFLILVANMTINIDYQLCYH